MDVALVFCKTEFGDCGTKRLLGPAQTQEPEQQQRQRARVPAYMGISDLQDYAVPNALSRRTSGRHRECDWPGHHFL
jgi:hypothetical protein